MLSRAKKLEMCAGVTKHEFSCTKAEEKNKRCTQFRGCGVHARMCVLFWLKQDSWLKFGDGCHAVGKNIITRWFASPDQAMSWSMQVQDCDLA